LPSLGRAQAWAGEPAGWAGVSPEVPCLANGKSLDRDSTARPYSLDVSPLDPFPFVRTGRELAKRPLRVQVLALLALAAFWVLTGVALRRTWPVAIGVVFVIVLVVKLVQAQRKPDPQ